MPKFQLHRTDGRERDQITELVTSETHPYVRPKRQRRFHVKRVLRNDEVVRETYTPLELTPAERG